MSTEEKRLGGLRVLVVEDAFLIAMDLCDQLADLGCEVIGPAASVKQALAELDGITPDGAMLDVNLEGERSFPIAEWLAGRGVPFVFLTGYDATTAFPDEFKHAPRFAKPVDSDSLASALAHFRTTGSAK